MTDRAEQLTLFRESRPTPPTYVVFLSSPQRPKFRSRYGADIYYSLSAWHIQQYTPTSAQRAAQLQAGGTSPPTGTHNALVDTLQNSGRLWEPPRHIPPHLLYFSSPGPKFLIHWRQCECITLWSDSHPRDVPILATVPAPGSEEKERAKATLAEEEETQVTLSSHLPGYSEALQPLVRCPSFPRNRNQNRFPSCKNFTLPIGSYDPPALNMTPLSYSEQRCFPLPKAQWSRSSRQEIALCYSPRTKNSAQGFSPNRLFEFCPKLTNIYFTLLTPGRPCSDEHNRTKKRRRMPSKLCPTHFNHFIWLFNYYYEQPDFLNS